MRVARLIGILGVTTALAACQGAVQELKHFPEIFNPAVNTTEYNYGAADALIGQAKGLVSLNDPISIGTLHPVNLKPTERIPPFGKVVADQIGTRLVQLGYNVNDLGIGVADANEMTERDWISQGMASNSAAIITGNYTISEYDVMVNLRMLNVKTGRILAATDYRVPLGSDTYKMINRDPYFGQPVKVPGNNPEQAPKMPPIERADLPALPVKIIP